MRQTIGEAAKMTTPVTRKLQTPKSKLSHVKSAVMNLNLNPVDFFPCVYTQRRQSVNHECNCSIFKCNLNIDD